jgi:predicted Zn finger-like uncharacterized protein
MIIICPSCKKKFEVDSNIIPEKGKLVKCGSCDLTWFFNKHNQVNINTEIITKTLENENEKTLSKPHKKKSATINEDISNLPNNKGSELVKYQPKLNFTFGKILNYLIVLIISFVAAIIVLDTFKDPLSTFFPNIDLILYNLFETLKDLILFIKDLN